MRGLVDPLKKVTLGVIIGLVALPLTVVVAVLWLTITKAAWAELVRVWAQ
jgi:hypothetical protein